MLKITLNRLKPQVEKIIVEEQADQEGVPQSRSSTCAFYVRNISSTSTSTIVFIDLKKTFDRVWQAALWATIKKYNISTNLIQVIKKLYNKATSAVLFNSGTGDWFRTTAGVRQGCLISPTLFNIFLERIMTDPFKAVSYTHLTLPTTILV